MSEQYDEDMEWVEETIHSDEREILEESVEGFEEFMEEEVVEEEVIEEEWIEEEHEEILTDEQLLISLTNSFSQLVRRPSAITPSLPPLAERSEPNSPKQQHRSMMLGRGS
jgi:hypothetical protein